MIIKIPHNIEYIEVSFTEGMQVLTALRNAVSYNSPYARKATKQAAYIVPDSLSASHGTLKTQGFDVFPDKEAFEKWNNEEES